MATLMKMISNHSYDPVQPDVKGFSLAGEFGVVIPDTIENRLIESILIDKPANRFAISIRDDEGTLPVPTVILPSGASYLLTWSTEFDAYIIIDSDLTDWFEHQFYSMFEFMLDGFHATPKGDVVPEPTIAEEIAEDVVTPEETEDELIHNAVCAGASNADLKSRFGLTAKQSRELRKAIKDK